MAMLEEMLLDDVIEAIDKSYDTPRFGELYKRLKRL